MKRSPIINATVGILPLAFLQGSAVGVYGIGRNAESRPKHKGDIGGSLAREGDVWVNANTGHLWLLIDTSKTVFYWKPVGLRSFDEKSQSRIRNYVDLDVYEVLMEKVYGRS